MQGNMLLLLLLAVSGACLAQKHCCLPSQFTVVEEVVDVMIHAGKGDADIGKASTAFDFTNNRVGQIVTSFDLSAGEVDGPYKLIIDYNKNYTWIIEEKAEACLKANLPPSYLKHCVPESSTYVGPGYIGENKVTTDSFAYYYNEFGLMANATLAVTRENCTPFFASYLGTLDNEPVMIQKLYVNYTEGIKNPDSWFKVPSYCHQSSEQHLPSMRKLIQRKMMLP